MANIAINKILGLISAVEMGQWDPTGSRTLGENSNTTSDVNTADVWGLPPPTGGFRYGGGLTSGFPLESRGEGAGESIKYHTSNYMQYQRN